MPYHRPRSLSDALALRAGGGVRLLAGGTDLYAATPAPVLSGDIVDLTAVSGLSGIGETPEGWRIGATTRWSEIAGADLPPAFDALKQAAREVGAVQIQNSGTIGGNLCNASPAADGVPPLLALDAEVEIASRTETRRQGLAAFLTGARATTLGDDEILTAIHIPADATRGTSAFGKLGARRYLVISIVMVAVRLELERGRIGRAAVAVGACSPVAQRLPGLEAALAGQAPGNPHHWRAALEADIAQRLAPIDDIRADAAYRRGAVAELVIDTIARAAAP